MKALLLKIAEIVIPEFIKNLFSSKKVEKRKIKQLADHDVFATLARVRKEIALKKFYTHGEYDETKTAMCYDFAKHKTRECAQGMYDIVFTPGVDSMNRDALKKFILDWQQQMHVNYINEIKKEWRNKDVQEKDIDYVIHLFEKFRYDVIVSFEYRINSIFGSTYNKTNFSLVLAVYEMWAMGIDLLPADMSRTFQAINGHFKQIKYAL